MMRLCEKMADALKPYAPLPIRLTLGVVMFAHGAQKMLGWYGGDGFKAWTGAIQSMGYQPAVLFAALAGGSEFFGSILVFLGLFTRIAALFIAGTMVIAITTVHWAGGLFASNNGYEYPLCLFAAAVSLMMSGAGALSLDRIFKLPLR